MTAGFDQKSLFFYANPPTLSTLTGFPGQTLTSPFFSILALTAGRLREYYCALMLDCLPESVEPIGLADVGRTFHGEVAVSAFDRLRPLLSDSEGVLRVQLAFRLDERRIRVLRGSIDGEIHLACQRCLQALVFPLRLEFSLGIVSDETEIDRLPEGYEPLLVNGDPIRTVELIEDEVLLVIPAVPVHGDGQPCDSGYQNQPVAEKDNPFSVLEKLKTQ